MVTGVAPATMASGGPRRSTSGTTAGGERERMEGCASTGSSPGDRWRGRRELGSDGGDELVRERGGRSSGRRRRFARTRLSRRGGARCGEEQRAERGEGGRAPEHGVEARRRHGDGVVLPSSSRAQLRRTEERQDLKSRKRTFRSGWWHQPGPKGLSARLVPPTGTKGLPFRSGWCHQPDLKTFLSFSEL